MKLSSDKSTGDEKEKLELKAHKMLFQLSVVVFLITYFNNQIIFRKCLNNIFYLWNLFTLV